MGEEQVLHGGEVSCGGRGQAAAQGVTTSSAVVFHTFDPPPSLVSVSRSASARFAGEGGTTGRFGMIPGGRPPSELETEETAPSFPSAGQAVSKRVANGLKYADPVFTPLKPLSAQIK